ncbi:MAG: DUF1990 family protein [Pyrinomonadaceae bacterium]
MFLISKPSRPKIDKFIENARSTEFSYLEVGASRDNPPATYNIDENRILLAADFETAKAAIRSWKMFGLKWVDICWPATPIEVGQTVAVLVNHLEFYSLNAARIVYVTDEANRFGFAYGTLLDHSESGEERFMVEIDPLTGEVWYELFAFSRPGHLFAKLGYPYARMLQKQFAIDSLAAMKRAVDAC